MKRKAGIETVLVALCALLIGGCSRPLTVSSRTSAESGNNSLKSVLDHKSSQTRLPKPESWANFKDKRPDEWTLQFLIDAVDAYSLISKHPNIFEDSVQLLAELIPRVLVKRQTPIQKDKPIPPEGYPPGSIEWHERKKSYATFSEKNGVILFDPTLFKGLEEKNRKALVLHSYLSVKNADPTHLITQKFLTLMAP